MKRNLQEAALAGVCAGVADFTGIDKTILRAILIIATLLGFGLPIIIYIVLALIMPSE